MRHRLHYRRRRLERLEHMIRSRVQLRIDGETLVDVDMEQLYYIAKYGHGGGLDMAPMVDVQDAMEVTMRVITPPWLAPLETLAQPWRHVM
jgi:hypothetical protein